MRDIQLKITTPGGEPMQYEGVSANIPVSGGSIGILRNHAPLICAVEPGILSFRLKEGGEELRFQLGRGIGRVADNELSLLVSEARELE